MAELLEVRDLTIRFGDQAPVRDMGFDVKAGETLAIVGESGSGKSLTALASIGLLPRNAEISGSIRIDGQEMTTLPESERRRLRGRKIAMIFQEPMTSLNPVLRLGDQIAEGLRLHEGLSAKKARARVLELLDLVRIPDAARRIDDYPHQLSGGMRQRVMIAMAVACSPKLLIADEATTALDVTIQAQVLHLLDALRKDLGMAVMLITHDLGIVAQWADRVVVMYAGRKVEEGLPRDVFTNPLHPYTSGLIAASPRLNTAHHYRDGPLAEIPGSISSALLERGCGFRPRCFLAQPSCALAVPPLEEPSPGRLVACPYHALVGKRRFDDASVG